jgi:hypothetical protein
MPAEQPPVIVIKAIRNAFVVKAAKKAMSAPKQHREVFGSNPKV